MIQRARTTQRFAEVALVLVVSLLCFLSLQYTLDSRQPRAAHIRSYRRSLVERCRSIHTSAGPPPSFKPESRLHTGSDRYVPGTQPVLLRNAKILTGARNGTEIVFGDILLDKGLVFAVGYIPPNLLSQSEARGDLKIVDVGGKWVSPGLVDLHSHIGLHSLPGLRGVWSIVPFHCF